MSLSDLYYDSDEIGEDSNHSTGDEYEDQYSGYPFFKVCVFAEKMSCIEQEANKKNYS